MPLPTGEVPVAQGDRDPVWMGKLDAEYDQRNPMIYRPTWAEECSAADIPTQITSWRREAAGLYAQDPKSRIAMCMHAMADQMEYLWRALGGHIEESQ